MWKQRMITSLWWLLAISIAGLLTAGMQYKKHLPCSDIKVNIERVNGHVFIDEKEITELLKTNGVTISKSTADIPLQPLEKMLKKQPWIYNAELFFDNNQVLTVNILEREPLARIFTLQGTSFYIDSSGMQLPLSTDYSARVPMFTGFTSTKKKMSKPDSLLMNNIRKIAILIQQDSFWNAQTAQVNITSNKTFEIIPTLGDQVIKLGNADSLQSKFDRLTAFYKQVWSKEAFEKYETISVEFNGQVVATKRGIHNFGIDTTAATRLISAMRNGIDIANDTTTAKSAAAVLPTVAFNQTDSSALSSTQKIAAKKSNIVNNTAKQHKALTITKKQTSGIKKGVNKSKKRT